MGGLRTELETRLTEIEGIEIATWRDTQLVCVFFDGRDFAHFHGDDILDIRLSVKIIREERLSRSVSERIHPNRSQNSRWIGVEFKSASDVEKLVHLVKRACDELM